jgi:pyridoxamine 5'-phosphate oxidase
MADTTTQSGHGLLDHGTLDADPIRQCRRWYDEAVATDLPDANAMTLATSTPDGKPSARIVLLKRIDDRGFVFFTNYRSRKGAELASNPRAALILFWSGLNRQVRIEGSVERIPRNESDAYFLSRPRENQLAALCSHQSEPLASRAELEARFEALKGNYEGKPVPRPDHWGGFRVIPESIEFWLGHPARLNERVLYQRQSSGRWKTLLLAP